MTPSFRRFIAVLLVPCVIASSITPSAAAPSFARTPLQRHAGFETQALTLALAGGLFSLSLHSPQDFVHVWPLLKPQVQLGSRRRRTASQGEPNADEPLHRYEQVPEGKTKKILKNMRKNAETNLREEIKRFMAGLGSPESDIPQQIIAQHVPFDEDILQRDNAHMGLLRDEKGVLWIVKRKAVRPEGMIKNVRRREMLFYLIARGRANVTEIRFLTGAEAKLLPQFDRVPQAAWDDMYLTRLVTEKNIPLRMLPQRDRRTALAALLVADTFMQKGDPHVGNYGYRGNIPVAVDHDYALLEATFDDPDSFLSFIGSYVDHRVRLFSAPLLGFLQWPQERLLWLIEDFMGWVNLFNSEVRPLSEEVGEFRNIMAHYGLGLGALARDDWDLGQIRRSIKAFKSISEEDLGSFARQAGYSHEDLIAVVQFLLNQQASLESDVHELLDSLTNRRIVLGRRVPEIGPASARLVPMVMVLAVALNPDIWTLFAGLFSPSSLVSAVVGASLLFAIRAIMPMLKKVMPRITPHPVRLRLAAA